MSTPRQKKEHEKIERTYRPRTNKTKRKLAIPTEGNLSKDEINKKDENIEQNIVDPFEDILNVFDDMNKARNNDIIINELMQEKLDTEIAKRKEEREREARIQRIEDVKNERIEKQERKEARKSKIKQFFRDFFKALRKPLIKVAAIGAAAVTLLPAAAAITKDHKGDVTNNEQETKLVDNNQSNNKDENNIYDQAYNEIHNDDTQNEGRISNLAKNTNKEQLINKVENKIIYFLSKKGINNVSKIFIASNNLYSAQTMHVNPQNGVVRENYRTIGTHITDEQKRAMDIINNLNLGNLKGNQESELLNELYGLADAIDDQINGIENIADMDQPSIQSDNMER